jgi:hypothetical protein
LPRFRSALSALLALGALVVAAAIASPASAASSCPTQTFLSYGHLAYEAIAIPSTVQVPGGSTLGNGTIDEPTSGNGCHRAQSSVQVQAVGSTQPQVAVLVRGRPHLAFVIGHRCDGLTGSAYWNCLLHPIVFRGQQFTATSYPLTPAPRRTLPLGSAIGIAQYQGRQVTVRGIQGIDPSLAVGISGQPSTAFLSPRACPYSGFSNSPQYDNLLRCLRGPVWYTFDPPGNEAGQSVVGRSDRSLVPAVQGASISLVRLPLVADYVPANHGNLVGVGQVSDQVSIKIPDIPAGVYEAVVSCPRCGSGGVAGLYPAGSILVTSQPKGDPIIKDISYVLLALVIVAAILGFRTYRRRRAAMRDA